MIHTRTGRLSAGMSAVTLLAAVAVGAQRTDHPEELLHAAMHKEVVVGDLQGAMADYQRVASNPAASRAIAAQALVRLAGIYETVGNAEARTVFEDVVRRFGDQPAVVAVAQASLARTAASGPTRRRLTDAPGLRGVSISPDGRFLSSAGRDATVRDLVTGERWTVSNRTDPWDYADTSAISRDGRQVAFTWYNNASGFWRNELRVAPIDGRAPSRLLFAANDVYEWFQAFDWSPDGQWLAVDMGSQLGLISVRDGSLQILKSGDWRGPTRATFSPDGRYVAFDLTVGQAPGLHYDIFVVAIDGSRETPIVVGPSDDTVMAWSTDGRHLLFASDRTGPVSLWALPMADGRPQGTATAVAADVQRRSLGVSTTGGLYIGTSLSEEDVNVAALNVDAGTLERVVKPIQRFLGTNRQPVWSPDGRSLAYISTRLGDSERMLGIQSVETGEIREFRPGLYFQAPTWAPDGRSLIVAGRDARNREGTYRIDARTGESQFIGRIGSQQLSPDGRKAYLRDEADHAISERDLSTGAVRVLARLESSSFFAPTLSPDGRFIATTTVDAATGSTALLLVRVDDGQTRELVRLHQPDTLLLRSLTWMPNDREILIGKDGDSFLLVPIDGGAPRRVAAGVSFRPNLGLDVHPDGTHIAFVAGEAKQEVWVLEHFLP